MSLFAVKLQRTNVLNVVFLFVVSILAEFAVAEEESEEAAPATPQAIYLAIKPAFVVNYGGKGRLKYIKAEVSVRLANSTAANAVRHHMPFVRNNLVLLFAAQTDESVSSQVGKEKLRKDALEEVRKVVEREERLPPEEVVDLFFNNLIVQK